MKLEVVTHYLELDSRVTYLAKMVGLMGLSFVAAYWALNERLKTIEDKLGIEAQPLSINADMMIEVRRYLDEAIRLQLEKEPANAERD